MAKSASAFNLLDEPWVRVMNRDCAVEEVSLRDALLRAHGLKDLAGELPTQDAALLRLLLAVLFAVFARVDAAGHPAPLASGNAGIEAAVARWKELWALGRFPEAPLDAYFATWHDRFWLFDEEHPFWQVPEKKWKRHVKKDGTEERAGTPVSLEKFNVELLQSGNKARLFASVSSEACCRATYAQAARWLVYFIACDDSSIKKTRDLEEEDEPQPEASEESEAEPQGEGEKKKKTKTYPATGVGWLGKIGYVQAVGDTLFETLMYNLTFLRDGSEAWEWSVPKEDEEKPWLYLPYWELDAPRVGERTPLVWPSDRDCVLDAKDPERNEAAMLRRDRKPANPMALLTLQSRRVLFIRYGVDETPPAPYAPIKELRVLGGDFFDEKNAFCEQMTLWWAKTPTQAEPTPPCLPKRHDASTVLWQEFGSLLVSTNEQHMPGVVQWLDYLQGEGYLADDLLIRFRVCGSDYGSQYSKVEDTFTDVLSFRASLLGKMELGWREKINREVKKCCDDMVKALQQLAEKLAVAAGGDKKTVVSAWKKRAVKTWYARLDTPFRDWLAKFSPRKGSVAANQDLLKWQRQARMLAVQQGEELVVKVGPQAFVGRRNGKTLIAAPTAYRAFVRAVSKTYPKEEEVS